MTKNRCVLLNSLPVVIRHKIFDNSLLTSYSTRLTTSIYNNSFPIFYFMLSFYGVLRYLSSIAILSTTRDLPRACPKTHALHRSWPHYLADNQHFDWTTSVLSLKCVLMSCASYSYYQCRSSDIAAVGTFLQRFKLWSSSGQ